MRILVEATQTPEDIAQRTCTLYFEERAGRAILPDGGLSLDGLRAVISFAEETGSFEGSPPPSVERLADLSYWQRARRERPRMHRQARSRSALVAARCDAVQAPLPRDGP